MSIEFDIACLRAPCDPDDCIGIAQLISRARMAADQMEVLIKQRNEALAALESIRSDIEFVGNIFDVKARHFKSLKQLDAAIEHCKATP